MKKLLVGLLALGSVSSFAKTLDCSIYKLDTASKSELRLNELISTEKVNVSSGSIIIINNNEVSTYNFEEDILELSSRNDLKGKEFYSFNKYDTNSLSLTSGKLTKDTLTLLSTDSEIFNIAAGKNDKISLYEFSTGRAIDCK
jgi:hypothetical protein